MAEVHTGESATNAVRIVSAREIDHEIASYEYDESSGAEDAATKLGVDPEVVYKTLVAMGDRSGVAVFCVPANCELDLKKAARVSENKSVHLVAVRELKPLTGYVRGGCSPIGMKRQYPTYLEELAQGQERIYINAGRRGLQMLLSPVDLVALTQGEFADLV